MKLYRNLSEAVVQNLHDIFEGNRYADKVIEKVLKQNPKWGARDRRFIAETTYDIVRWYRLFRELSGAQERDYWSLLATWCIWNTIELPPWKEFEGIQPREVEENYERVKSVRKIRESIPDWLDTLGEAELPAWWDKELHALNEQAKVVLRVNTLKISREGLQKLLLEEEGIETERLPEFPDALLLEERQNIFTRQAFKDGLFEVQDAASQRIAAYLDVKPGMRVIDACAGAGGKTLHLAALMQNKGRIIAMDTEGWKLDELKKRARRAGASDLIEARLIDSSKVIKRLEASADRLLLDVPCSGLGVLRRNPDAKWKLSLEFIEKVQVLQQEIFQQYSVMVKPGGMMVYATCSILPSENEKQVEKFLATHGDKFEMLSQDRCWPSEGYDGFFMAKIRRRQ
ncbi:MAG: RsmB/NOP family class I SAM-dependent RNA methyltransferase [Cyclobacteriaceae bacterium]|nr:RsmB/NOP family class I SAM-dependent RNA methyltransferase [Cyclobacteriaceae bacterium]